MKQDDNRVDAFVFTGDGATSSSPITFSIRVRLPTDK